MLGALIARCCRTPPIVTALFIKANISTYCFSFLSIVLHPTAEYVIVADKYNLLSVSGCVSHSLTNKWIYEDISGQI